MPSMNAACRTSIVSRARLYTCQPMTIDMAETAIVPLNRDSQ